MKSIGKGCGQAVYHLHLDSVRLILDVHPLEDKEPQTVTLGLDDLRPEKDANDVR